MARVACLVLGLAVCGGCQTAWPKPDAQVRKSATFLFSPTNDGEWLEHDVWQERAAKPDPAKPDPAKPEVARQVPAKTDAGIKSEIPDVGLPSRD